MAVIAIDLGGTKIAAALFLQNGELVHRKITMLDDAEGDSVGSMIVDLVLEMLHEEHEIISGIGISIPGISRKKTGSVWAPNINDWEDYPLQSKVQSAVPGIPVIIDSDRACCILGEVWQGNAQGCSDAIFLTIGTGIGAGILADHKILHGAHDISGAIGWMALQKPYSQKYDACGCFEYYSSGDGIARLAQELVEENQGYGGRLLHSKITAHEVFDAFSAGDPVAVEVLKQCVQYWGMACANLISIFNPEKIIFGGGVFGPALQFLDAIKAEASLWAQPISMTQVRFAPSVLGSDTPLYGAAYLALSNVSSP
ncbi:MAG: ROK family protein [Saprospiraceae bacterium]|jgi:glucokinase|nr:ROK family protein [Saprospiraceae bacterium]MBP7801408.1 ROK family protein [Saprospiraceae bacterium]MBP8097082.1 ROK family protein [Saprospiraceae bacterium]